MRRKAAFISTMVMKVMTVEHVAVGLPPDSCQAGAPAAAGAFAMRGVRVWVWVCMCGSAAEPPYLMKFSTAPEGGTFFFVNLNPPLT